MNTHLFTAFLLITVVLFLTPGPIVTLIIATGARQGTRAALLTVAGASAGNAVLGARIAVHLQVDGPAHLHRHVLRQFVIDADADGGGPLEEDLPAPTHHHMGGQSLARDLVDFLERRPRDDRGLRGSQKLFGGRNNSSLREGRI